MTVCPVAIAVGCKKCPVFGMCPLKTVIGDYRPTHDSPSKPREAKTGHAGKRTR